MIAAAYARLDALESACALGAQAVASGAPTLYGTGARRREGALARTRDPDERARARMQLDGMRSIGEITPGLLAQLCQRSSTRSMSGHVRRHRAGVIGLSIRRESGACDPSFRISSARLADGTMANGPPSAPARVETERSEARILFDSCLRRRGLSR
jgi:hypothetical protein